MACESSTRIGMVDIVAFTSCGGRYPLGGAHVCSPPSWYKKGKWGIVGIM